MLFQDYIVFGFLSIFVFESMRFKDEKGLEIVQNSYKFFEELIEDFGIEEDYICFRMLE